jgi:hypothetical protein
MLHSRTDQTGNLLWPQYPAIYLVESQEMKEARSLPNAVIEEAVRELDEVADQEMCVYRQSLVNTRWEHERQRNWKQRLYNLFGIQILVWEQRFKRQQNRDWRQVLKHCLKWVILAVTAWIPTVMSILIIYSFTNFRKESSTVAQRVWIMCWFCFGNCMKVLSAEDSLDDSTAAGRRVTFSYLMLLYAVALYSAPSIGGFIVVGKMLSEYGICTLIS